MGTMARVLGVWFDWESYIPIDVEDEHLMSALCWYYNNWTGLA